MRSRYLRSLGTLVVFTGVLLGFVLWKGYTPFLGLDLQGGVSVVLKAKAPDEAEARAAVLDAITSDQEALGLGEVTVKESDERVVVTPKDKIDKDTLNASAEALQTRLESLGVGETEVKVTDGTLVARLKSVGVPTDSIDQAIAIIRSRVDAIGVAEPEITRQGNNVIVQIPGVKDPDAALELVGQTAELRFRPVLQILAPEGEKIEIPETTTTTAGEGDASTTTVSTVEGETTTTAAGGDAGSSTTTPTTAAPTTTTAAGGDDQQSMGVPGGGEFASGRGPSPTTTVPIDDTGSTVPATDTTATDPTATDPTATDPTATDPTATTAPEMTDEQLQDFLNPPTTKAEDDVADATVVLKSQSGKERYQLGPTLVTGKALSGATAQLSQNGQWQVVVTFKSGKNGSEAFDAAAAKCNPPDPTICPAAPGQTVGALAIVLDHEVISAPAINATNFGGRAEITGNFTEDEAQDLALVLRYGALPVELEPQTTQRVSATLGHDALDAGLVAGVVGLLLVTLYMLFFYRLLGALAILKLAIEGALLWSIIAVLGETQGLALTLAGVTGIIVSIGVSLDSNVVYYEHLKEDVHSGRTIRSTIDRSFDSSFSTIVKADGASLIGAGLLYWLTVGPVRGFALYLAISTILDLICSWFYMRPVVGLALGSKLAQRNPAAFGLPAAPTVDDDAETATLKKKKKRDRRADDGVDLEKAEVS